MRFSNRGLLRTSFLRKSEFRKILMTNLGLTSTDADKFLDMKENSLNLPRYRVIKNCLICQVGIQTQLLLLILMRYN